MSRIPPLEGTANGWQWGQHRPTNLAPTMINGGHNQRRMTVTIICQCSVERYSTLGMDQTDYIRLHYLGGWTSFTFYFHVNFRQSYFQLLFFFTIKVHVNPKDFFGLTFLSWLCLKIWYPIPASGWSSWMTIHWKEIPHSQVLQPVTPLVIWQI